MKKLPFRSARLALVLASTLFTGCASTPPTTSNDFAMLELENQSSEAIHVSLNGRVEASLQPGTRKRVRYIRPRTHTLEARTQEDGARIAQSQLSLARGELKRWVVPATPGNEPRLAPEFALLEVSNPTDQDLEVLVLDATSQQEQARATLSPKGIYRFEELTQGANIVLFRLQGLEVARHELSLSPELTHSTFAFTRASVSVQNETGFNLTFLVDGLAQGNIPAHTSTTFYIKDGHHHLAVRDSLGRFSQEEVRELSLSTHNAWKVSEGKATLVVENKRPEALALRLVHPNGQTSTQLVEAEQSLPLTELQPGIYQVQAFQEEATLSFQTQVVLTQHEVRTLTIAPLERALRISNPSTSEAYIYRVDGKGSLKEVARLAPHAERRLAVKQDEEITLRAVLAPSKENSRISQGEQAQLLKDRTFESTFQVLDEADLTWELEEALVSLEIRNKRSEAITVFLDGARKAEVEPNRTLVLSGIPANAYRVELVGRISQHAERETVALTVNRAEGQGHHVVVAHEAPKAQQAITKSSPHSSSAAHATSSPQASSQTATLAVHSLFHEDLALSLNGDILGVIAPGQLATYTNLVAGPSLLQAVGVSTGRVHAFRLELVKAKQIHFALKAPEAKLVVENQTPYPLVLKQGSTLLGGIEANRTKLFGGLGVGKQTIEVQGQGIQLNERHQLEFLEGDTKRLIVKSDQGLVRLRTFSPDSYTFFLNGQVVARLEASENQSDAPMRELTLAIPVGSQHLRVERLSPTQERSFEVYPLALKPNELFDIQLSATEKPLRVVNQTSQTLTIFSNGLEVLTLAPQASEWINLKHSGETMLEAKDSQGQRTHLESLKSGTRRLSSWVLTSSEEKD